MIPLSDKIAWNDLLQNAVSQFERLYHHPGLGKKALGLPEMDALLWKKGHEWLTAHTAEIGETSFEHGPDVYLATMVYSNGGHTPLIGDFVKALDPEATSSHLILTQQGGEDHEPLAEKIRIRTHIPQANITHLKGETFADRLEDLVAHLGRLKPRRLFLFHHYNDPLACVVAHPLLAKQSVLVHHADSLPSLGLHLPGIQMIDLHPSGAATSRMLGLNTSLLLLTSPDPGPRPPGFLKRGHLVTASSGSGHKYESDYVYSYEEAVALILQTTGGWHVHIGPLKVAILDQIKALLEKANVPWERFIYVPWAPSVAQALWDHDCDLYLSSFPIDGARTNAEVLAAAIPHLRHSMRLNDELQYDLAIKDGLVWRTWDDLKNVLREMSDQTALERKSREMRAAYESMHHPDVFAAQLREILEHQKGRLDPQQHERDHLAIHSFLKTLCVSATGTLTSLKEEIAQIKPHQCVEYPPLFRIDEETRSRLSETESRLNETRSWLHKSIQELGEQKKRISFLQEQRSLLKEKNETLQAKVKRLENVQKQWRSGKGLRATLRRWLFKS